MKRVKQILIFPEDVFYYITRFQKGNTQKNSIPDFAAKKGYLYLVQYLHNIKRDKFTFEAMIWAVWKGHYETVKWLHDNRKERFLYCELDESAILDELECVIRLYKHKHDSGEYNTSNILHYLMSKYPKNPHLLSNKIK